jgi:hypothetical protein
MKRLLKDYLTIPGFILRIIAVEYFLQILNSALMMILLIYMSKKGIDDSLAGSFISKRFMGVILLSLPFGIFIKKRNVLPFLKFASFALPIVTIVLVESVNLLNYRLINTSIFLWGCIFAIFQVSILPFILNNTPSHRLTNAISLNYATYSLGSITSGLIIFVLMSIPLFHLDERWVLHILSIFSLLASITIFYSSGQNKKIKSIDQPVQRLDKGFDWKDLKKIAFALFPTIIIAVGAGLTIPFIGLFFYQVHHKDTQYFAVLGTIASLLVAQMAFLVPYVKERWGYKKSIPITQSIAILALLGLAMTEYLQGYSWAVYLASFLYIIRQPLMNMAAPMTSEVVMIYVGEQNREITSALTSAIWSGSWFFSAQIFSILRKYQFHYAEIFTITAILYFAGVIFYTMLVYRSEK